MSSSRDSPLVSHVSVTMAISASNSLKQSIREWIFGHRDRAFVLIIVKDVTEFVLSCRSFLEEEDSSSASLMVLLGLPVLNLS